MLQVLRAVLVLASLAWLAAWGVAGYLAGISWAWLGAYAGAVLLLGVMGLMGLRMDAHRGDFAFAAGAITVALAFATFLLLPVVAGGLGVLLAILLPPRRRAATPAAPLPRG